jgi:hypothetical protein
MRSSSSSTANEASPSEESGFTILETMVVLAVCSIALFSLWALATRLSSAYVKAENSGAATLKATTLDRALRSLCARVEIPFWSKIQGDDFSDGSATVAFLDGDPNSYLRIRSSSSPGSRLKDVSIETGKTALRLEGFDSFTAEPLRSADGRIAGISIKYGCGGTERESRALFSSWSFAGKEGK